LRFVSDHNRKCYKRRSDLKVKIEWINTLGQEFKTKISRIHEKKREETDGNEDDARCDGGGEDDDASQRKRKQLD
jgi:hypothetical protein